MRAHRLLVLAAVLGCASGPPVGRTGGPSPHPPSPVAVDSLLRALTPRQKVGQLVVPRLSGAYAALDDSLFQVAGRGGDSLEGGGLTGFAGAPFDVAAKLNSPQLRAPRPLLVFAGLQGGAGVGARVAPALS